MNTRVAPLARRSDSHSRPGYTINYYLRHDPNDHSSVRLEPFQINLNPHRIGADPHFGFVHVEQAFGEGDAFLRV